ncbi:hypothetical protein CFE70_007131 [Pyrenophora teres f. teres 0-1]|uniref:Uncharacterized protein n=2 Tax=Pyrenophora teres f. teres TaxID=97479 RepID=E3RQU8_PYRTT|nr:hypothetical protein PTT_11138 [Pyrenophora teres f. teres 0-1]KAE8825874.1 hypothetical protein HRS9139_08984 [Pyrenophora teres f. teres]KAE8834973.1 hypothetical protein PTNB85_06306 [Pyrenophora teres f. teres]KAE8843551.1 hypothetical protein HRS9122_04654 [Pyrenophora teres f. teres]KAE8856662.1 hypothetical protein PTNB73_09384 [Pyrenophora teres f. teres]
MPSIIDLPNDDNAADTSEPGNTNSNSASTADQPRDSTSAAPTIAPQPTTQSLNLPTQYISSGAYVNYYNIAIPLPSPYRTHWSYGEQSIWSRGLIQYNHFDYNDSALLSFTIDCAMKLYIIKDIVKPAQSNNLRSLPAAIDSMAVIPYQTRLAWLVIWKVAHEVTTQVRARGYSIDQNMASAEFFFILAMRGVLRIVERNKIMLRQRIQDPLVKYVMAVYISRPNSFVGLGTMIHRVFAWVYGEWPSVVFTDGLKEGDFARASISIPERILEYN